MSVTFKAGDKVVFVEPSIFDADKIEDMGAINWLELDDMQDGDILTIKEATSYKTSDKQHLKFEGKMFIHPSEFFVTFVRDVA